MSIKTFITEDLSPSVYDFKEDVLNGLSLPFKKTPSKYLYDELGSYYFECLCQCKEYYVTRTEIEIMGHFAKDMASLIGEKCLVLEYGSGSSAKTKFLLDHLPDVCAYVPIDICSSSLIQSSLVFSELYPQLEVLPLCADFTKPFEIHPPSQSFNRKLIYFPGSTIGNFTPDEAGNLLLQIRSQCAPGDLFLLGVDLKKSKRILHAAYNDKEGYTGSFNLNLLKRINRELEGNFHLGHFRHLAFYNEDLSRIEMHLVSTCDQEVTIGEEQFYFYEEESIHTESSYKYDLQELKNLTGSKGFLTRHVWLDRKKLFAVILLESYL